MFHVLLCDRWMLNVFFEKYIIILSGSEIS